MDTNRSLLVKLLTEMAADIERDVTPELSSSNESDLFILYLNIPSSFIAFEKSSDGILPQDVIEKLGKNPAFMDNIFPLNYLTVSLFRSTLEDDMNVKVDEITSFITIPNTKVGAILPFNFKFILDIVNLISDIVESNSKLNEMMQIYVKDVTFKKFLIQFLYNMDILKEVDFSFYAEDEESVEEYFEYLLEKDDEGNSVIEIVSDFKVDVKLISEIFDLADNYVGKQLIYSNPFYPFSYLDSKKSFSEKLEICKVIAESCINLTNSTYTESKFHEKPWYTDKRNNNLKIGSFLLEIINYIKDNQDYFIEAIKENHEVEFKVHPFIDEKDPERDDILNFIQRQYGNGLKVENGNIHYVDAFRFSYLTNIFDYAVCLDDKNFTAVRNENNLFPKDKYFFGLPFIFFQMIEMLSFSDIKKCIYIYLDTYLRSKYISKH